MKAYKILLLFATGAAFGMHPYPGDHCYENCGGDSGRIYGTVLDGSYGALVPIPGAAVTIYPEYIRALSGVYPSDSGGSTSYNPPDVQPVYTGVTDNKGQYSISGLPLNLNYSVTAGKEGYLSSSQFVFLSDTAMEVGLDLIPAPPEKTGAIEGHVYYDAAAEGCLGGPTGWGCKLPLEGVTVEVTEAPMVIKDSAAYSNGSDPSILPPARSWLAVTGADGYYRIEGVPLCSYSTFQVSAYKDGFTTAVEYVNLNQAVTTVDFVLGINTPGDKSGTLSGTVYSFENPACFYSEPPCLMPSVMQPLPGVQITVSKTWDDPVILNSSQFDPAGVVFVTHTDSLGRYEIPGIPLGEQYQVTASLDGYLSASTSLWMSGDASVDFSLEKTSAPTGTGTVKGTVTEATLYAPMYCRMVGDSCAPPEPLHFPVESALVRLTPAYLYEVTPATGALEPVICKACIPTAYSAYTDAKGAYAFDKVPVPGLYSMVVSKEGYEPSYQTIKAYGDTTTVDFTLYPTPSIWISGDGGTVERGVLPELNGINLEDFKLEISAEATSEPIHLEISIERTFPQGAKIPVTAVDLTVTGHEGGFHFDSPVKLTLPYDPSRVGDESKLALCYWNETAVRWEKISGAAADTMGNTVTGELSHLSTYGIVEEGASPIAVERIGANASPLFTFNHPNPFNPETHIFFQLNEAGRVALEIYNAAGQQVFSLNNGFAKGAHRVAWNGRDPAGKTLAAGRYYYRLRTGNLNTVRPMLLLK